MSDRTIEAVPRKALGAAVVAFVAAASLVVSTQQPAARGLTGVTGLSHAYDAVFDARFDDLPALRSRACPPAPAEACQLLDAAGLWWRIQLDPLDTSWDARFLALANAAVDSASAWTEREPRRAEAWFYLGAAYGARVQWRSLRGERLEAARDGKRIKTALEEALALDPSMADARFGLGLYQYYADVAPAALKILRWLLLLPGGDRTRGLSEMQLARRAGQLVRSDADYHLHLVYVWYEKQPARAIELLRELRTRHPHNPHFAQSIAEIQDFYIDDTVASLRSWQDLLEAAQRREVAEPELAETAARLGIASQYDQLSQGEAGLPHLHAVIAARPLKPWGAVARAHLQLGQTLEHLGRPDDASVAYRAAIAAAGPNDPLRIASTSRSALRALRR